MPNPLFMRTKKKTKTDKEKKKEDSDAFKEALRDCKITWLAKLGDKALYQELVGEGTNLTGVNIAMLNFLQAAEGEAKSWASVLEQAETTIKCVDQPGLLAWLGVKSDTSENAAEEIAAPAADTPTSEAEEPAPVRYSKRSEILVYRELFASGVFSSRSGGRVELAIPYGRYKRARW